MDPTDVSWIEQEYEEDLPRVKTVSTTKARPRVQDPEQMDLAGMVSIHQYRPPFSFSLILPGSRVPQIGEWDGPFKQTVV